jgi:hypothetical protein
MGILGVGLAVVLTLSPRAHGQTATQIAGCYIISIGIGSPAIGPDSANHIIPSASIR